MRFTVSLIWLTLIVFIMSVGHADEAPGMRKVEVSSYNTETRASDNLDLRFPTKRLLAFGSLAIKSNTGSLQLNQRNVSFDEERSHDDRLRIGKTVGRILSWVGCSVIIGGLVTGAIALKKDKKIEDNCPFGECPNTYLNTLETRDNLALTTDILLGVGGTLLVAGITTLIIVRKKDKKHGPNHPGIAGPSSHR